MGTCPACLQSGWWGSDARGRVVVEGRTGIAEALQYFCKVRVTLQKCCPGCPSLWPTFWSTLVLDMLIDPVDALQS